MAINQSVQNLELYPGTVKQVTLDVAQAVPVGTEGDEKMMLTSSTSAYSDNENRTPIQSLYILESKVGWAKSSGLRGAAGRFNLTSTKHKLGVSMDSTVSGTYTYNGRNYYEISLNYDDNTSILGENIAEDLQSKLRAINCGSEDAGFQLAYRNCSVKFESGKFYISSGTIGTAYSGENKTAVAVAPAPTEDCTAVLGFDFPVTSENLLNTVVTETLLMADYTKDTSFMTIGPDTGVAVGDALYITDGTNYDYFTAIEVTSNTLTVTTSGANAYTGVKHDYAVADGTYIQIVRKQDPDNKPSGYFKDLDELLRYMSKIMINQIDFSS